jgi:hypothetical protein
MSVKEQVIKIINEISVENVNFVKVCNSEELINKIQAIPDEVTLREVFEHCNNQYAKELPDTCYQCKYGNIYDDGYCSCLMQDEPGEWDIDKITKAVRGKE